MTELAVLDVGQGDCLVIWDDDGQSAVLVDCPGGRSSVPAAYFSAKGLMNLEALLVTHLHDDHYGGVVPFLVASSVLPKRVIIGPSRSMLGRHPKAVSFLRGARAVLPSNVEVEVLPPGQPISFGSVRMTLLWPANQDVLDVLQGGDTNLVSVASVVRVGGLTALLCSDAPSRRWRAVLDQGLLDDLDVDVLVVPHHGADFDARHLALSDFLTAVAPRTIILSVGSRNRYRHPALSTLADIRSYCARSGASLLCTQLNERCRIAATVNGSGAADTPCAGTVTVSGAGTGTERTGHPAFVSAQADPQCR